MSTPRRVAISVSKLTVGERIEVLSARPLPAAVCPPELEHGEEWFPVRPLGPQEQPLVVPTLPILQPVRLSASVERLHDRRGITREPLGRVRRDYDKRRSLRRWYEICLENPEAEVRSCPPEPLFKYRARWCREYRLVGVRRSEKVVLPPLDPRTPSFRGQGRLIVRCAVASRGWCSAASCHRDNSGTRGCEKCYAHCARYTPPEQRLSQRTQPLSGEWHRSPAVERLPESSEDHEISVDPDARKATPRGHTGQPRRRASGEYATRSRAVFPRLAYLAWLAVTKTRWRPVRPLE